MQQEKPIAGQADALEDGLLRVLAPNPSAMTFWGTNSYILGHDRVAVIDPGPNDPDHLKALTRAIAGRPVSHILVTHSHLDHSPLARALGEATDAPVLAFGDSHTGRSAAMQHLAASGLMGGGEGVDPDFSPDRLVADGDIITGDGWALRALHTPGHLGNHLSFLWGDIAFTGDHLMGWATSLVSPPDGDLTDFMASCTRLADTTMVRAHAGHGPPIAQAQDRLQALITHRKGREADILEELIQGPATPAALTARIYTDVVPALLPMAERNVLAHLVDLTTRGLTAPNGPLSARAHYQLT